MDEVKESFHFILGRLGHYVLVLELQCHVVCEPEVSVSIVRAYQSSVEFLYPFRNLLDIVVEAHRRQRSSLIHSNVQMLPLGDLLLLPHTDDELVVALKADDGCQFIVIQVSVAGKGAEQLEGA